MLKRRLQLRGLSGIDKRCGAGRALAEWRRELVADLGGRDAISAQQAAVIESAATIKLLMDTVGGWIVAQPQLVNGRRRSVYPVVAQWAQLADSLLRHLSALGLERRAQPLEDLETYITRRYGNGHEAAADEIPQSLQERRSDAAEGDDQATSGEPPPDGQAAGGAAP